MSTERAGPARTDWDAYYRHPARLAKVTRKVTERLLLETIDALHPSPQRICELGGANSAFYEAITRRYPAAEYIAIDNNTVGLELLARRAAQHARTRLLHCDLREMDRDDLEADLVLSVGLIEHFSPEDTARMIQTHFACARGGALVLMTFPTPTRLYRVVRGAAERAGRWIFHDERPLDVEAVCREAARYGVLERRFINWGALLTQGIVALRATRAGPAARALTPRWV